MNKLFPIILALLFFGCEQDSTSFEPFYGCTINDACNFNSDATIFDGSCLYNDCNGICGNNLNSLANIDYVSCDYLNPDLDSNDEINILNSVEMIEIILND